MMLPKRLSEQGFFAQQNRAINQLIDFVQSLEVRPSATTKVTRTSIGTIIEAAPQQTSSPSTGMRWRGQWSDTESYVQGDVVIIYGTANAGLWVAERSVPAGQAIPTDPPEQSGYWTLIAPGGSFGYWG